MKRIFFGFFILCSFVLLFNTGCKRKTIITKNDVVFDSTSVAETYYLFNDSLKPSCNLQINFVYPKLSEENKPLVNLFIENFFGEGFVNQAPESAAQAYKKQYIDEFKRFENENDSILKDMFANDGEDAADETGYSYYTRIKNAIKFNSNNLISFNVEYDNYEGGAHGSHSIYGYVVDLKSGTLIKEDQIFGEDYKGNLTAIILRKIAEDNGLDDAKNLETIGYGSIEDITPNGNFIVDDKGITYFYNENEIAAYVIGITKVFIPYEELKIFMKRDGLVAELAGL